MKELPFGKHWKSHSSLSQSGMQYCIYLTHDLATVHSGDNYYYTGTKGTHNCGNSQLIKFHILIGNEDVVYIRYILPFFLLLTNKSYKLNLLSMILSLIYTLVTFLSLHNNYKNQFRVPCIIKYYEINCIVFSKPYFILRSTHKHHFYIQGLKYVKCMNCKQVSPTPFH